MVLEDIAHQVEKLGRTIDNEAVLAPLLRPIFGRDPDHPRLSLPVAFACAECTGAAWLRS
jgi:hypothetical protein